MRTERLLYVDVAKGLAIILVVVGHTSIPKSVSDWAGLFICRFSFSFLGC